MIDLESKVAVLETQLKTVFKKLDKHDSEIDNITRLTIAVENIATKTELINDKVDSIDKRLNSVETAPAKKWEKAKETIWVAVLTGLVGAFVGAMITLLAK